MKKKALWGLEYTHAVPKSYQGLLEKSSRKVLSGVLSEKETALNLIKRKSE